ncbi:beta-propeller fold lactonase family protein [Arenimonas oryziterrae]|uniref:Ig-like domain-containing protein n=1 Tax=Arenimonas oryziterrae DSM 21050 = YC6267 TaxID=1121015 RepID=A0A091ASP6_9GAMM|nr:beta-propeller fold lactonase family protein [Arenimonas oryziterrae]KFN43213.1 hypothetical protein N789_11665 [Arenimonas oryziterrae DSM 21050 = YC6267]
MTGNFGKYVCGFLVLLATLAGQAASAQQYAFIPNVGSNTVSKIDLSTNAVVSTITLPAGSSPQGAAVNPSGTLVYVTRTGAANVAVINTATNAIVTNIVVGTSPRSAAVSPDGTRVYVTNYGSNTVTVINALTNTVVSTVTVGTGPLGLAITPSGSFVYVANRDANSVSVINTTTNTVASTIALAAGAGPWDIAINASGSLVYVANDANDTVTAINPATNTIISSFAVGDGPGGIAFTPNGAYAYTVNYGGNNVSVVNAVTNTLHSTLAIGTPNNSGPWGMSFNATGTAMYMTRSASARLSVISPATNTVTTASIAVGTTPYAMGAFIARPNYGQGALVSGNYHTCRLRTNGTAACWGRNDDGQTNAPAGVFKQLVAGNNHTCGLRTNGAVECWGNNTYGQSTNPTGTFISLAGGYRHNCGMLANATAASNGTLKCWGDNAEGQAPAVAPAGTNTQVSAGSSHNCSLRFDGTAAQIGSIRCWGNSALGQTTPATGADFVQVVSGSSFSCGLRRAGTIACWGDATSGKTTPPSGQFTQIAASGLYACGLRFNGDMVCWGDNTYGQTTVPTGKFVQLAPGRFHNCGMRDYGVVQCWGSYNVYNQAPQLSLLPSSAVLGPVARNSPFNLSLSLSVANPGVKTPYPVPTPAFGLIAGALPTGVTLSASGVLSGTPTLAGSYSFTIQAEDANGFVAQRAYSLVVTSPDTTAPVITPVITGLAGTNGWYRGNVTVNWTVTDPDSQVTSTVGCGTTLITTETAGTGVTCTATSAGGTSNATATIKLDKTAPTLVPTISDKRPLFNSTGTTASAAGATDSLSGLASQSCPPVATNVAGTIRLNCTATDNAGNVAIKPVSYIVIYAFVGFTDTVVNPGYFNSAGLNQPITFKWRSLDANGAPVTTLTSAVITSAAYACPASIKNVTPTSAEPLGFQNLGNGYYEYTWTTPASASCAKLTLTLQDGDHIHTALFSFQ